MKRNLGSEVEKANCLILLSQGGLGNPSRVFECKTCKRQFGSFQALGGHRASHKKSKLNDGDTAPPAKPKTHECSICGLEFAIGQALGGHMRRHRSDNHHRDGDEDDALSFNKSNTTTVLCLDLNLTPLENYLELFKLAIGKATPAIDCFF